MYTIPEINFAEVSGRNGNLGLITLTRPAVLNALNHTMFKALNEQLSEWEAANHIKAVVIRASEGRAFCAGGDIRYVYEQKNAAQTQLINFFRDEYLLNWRIHHYAKPYIAFLDGITMGGGAGISMHGSHRVATENLVFAMPETSIGFYPDVGMSYLLARLPQNLGLYLGLVGGRITQSDCAALGLVNHTVKQGVLPELLYALADAKFTDDAYRSVTAVLEPFTFPASETTLSMHQAEIAECFAKKTVEEIIQALETHASEWCQDVATILKTKSPTSLKVTLRYLLAAAKLEFDECIRTDYRLTTRFLAAPDFFEGIRATVIDKDQAPKWQPAKLTEVIEGEVEKYFASLAEELI